MSQRRLVSMSDPRLAALNCTVVAENWSGALRVRSGLDGRVTNDGVTRYRGLAGQHLAALETGADDGMLTLARRPASRDPPRRSPPGTGCWSTGRRCTPSPSRPSKRGSRRST